MRAGRALHLPACASLVLPPGPSFGVMLTEIARNYIYNYSSLSGGARRSRTADLLGEYAQGSFKFSAIGGVC
jgi:hypothetical protein